MTCLTDLPCFSPVAPISESLWGKMVDFMQQNCTTYWQLARPQDLASSMPLSACVDIRMSISTTQWTVFMYSHPDGINVKFGLEGNKDRLTIRLLGRRWTSKSKLQLGVWYSVCITWSEFELTPHLYVNGHSVDVHYTSSELMTLGDEELAANGILTLGASHFVLDGEVNAVSGTNFLGSVTLFRMWREKLSAIQVKQHCVEGDVVRWNTTDWITRGCAPVRDDRQCG